MRLRNPPFNWMNLFYPHNATHFYFREGKEERRNKCGEKKNKEGGEESGKMKGVRDREGDESGKRQGR